MPKNRLKSTLIKFQWLAGWTVLAAFLKFSTVFVSSRDHSKPEPGRRRCNEGRDMRFGTRGLRLCD